MFESMLMAPDDPILGLSKIYKSDIRNDKINLGIGVYVNKTGNVPILKSVKRAEEFLLKNESSKNYLSIEGIYAFNTATKSLLFGKNDSIISNKRIRTVQTPGGTGSLRIAAECISRNANIKPRVWISDPSWVNHKNIFLSAGLEVRTYPYYDKLNHSLNFNKLISTLNNQANSEDIILFHCCCHNPTGLDFSIEQWKILSEYSKKNKWIPLFDLAYQGFAIGLQEDLQGLHIFCKENPELIICNSYSKNFGLYNERVGACTIIAKNNVHAENTLSQLRAVIRANYSNPPSHGASIVSTILHDLELRSIWEEELKYMREHIKNMRKLFLKNLKIKCSNINKNFNFIEKQQGMFSFMGLNTEQVIKLRTQSGIYLVDSGRINLAGLSEDNIEYVCNSIQKLYC